jgi:membrane protease YdiL (CAAX protease family)
MRTPACQEAAAAPRAGLLPAAVLLAAGIALLPLAVRALRALARAQPAPAPAPPWGLLDALCVFAVGFAALLVAAWLAPREPLAVLWADAFVLGCAALAAAGLARARAPHGLQQLGLGGGGPRAVAQEATSGARAALAGVLTYALCFPALAGIGGLWPPLAAELGVELPDMQAVLEAILALEGPALWQAIGIACLLGPLFEELLFRGFLQPLAVHRLGAWRGVVLTSLLFAALHGAGAFPMIFALSLLLGALQHRTRRLAGAYAVHALHNAFTLFLALRFPELMRGDA